MPISTQDLYDYCEKEVIVLPGDAPLGQALWDLEQAGYAEASAWLVVELADGGYRVSRFMDLIPLLAEGGEDLLHEALSSLPLPAADRVIPTDTPASRDEILAWLADHPGATVIVVADGRCAGLFTNPALIPKGLEMRQPSVLEMFHALDRREAMAVAANGGDHAPLPPSPGVELYTDVDFPAHVKPQSVTPLVVKLSPEAPQSTRIEGTVSVEITDPHTPEIVEVLIHAPGFSERTDTWRRTIEVYGFTESTPAIFFLKASSTEGTYTIGVDFRHKERLIGSFRMETLVAAEAPPAADAGPTLLSDTADSEPESPTTLVISASPPPPADATLRIHLAEKRLSYTLHCPQAGFDQAKLGETPLRSDDPQKYLAALFAELSSLAHTRAGDQPDAVIRQLEASGENLYLDLFSEPLQAAYWKLVDLREAGTIRSLLIVSDEPWIPWELAKPYDADTDRSDDFLAGGWQICRWLAGPGPADRVQVAAARLVAPMLDLEFVEQEKRSFADMEGWGVDIGAGPLQRLAEIQTLSEQGGIELLHFATHGNFASSNPDQSAIHLADQALLSPGDLRGSRVRGLRKARPIVFLNACHTAQLGFAFTGLGGWAERMVVDVRASAFIGTLWEVNDALAAAFSQAFYRALRQGDTLGEAFHRARLHVRELQPANSTWLAYTLYGDPNVRVYWGD